MQLSSDEAVVTSFSPPKMEMFNVLRVRVWQHEAHRHLGGKSPPIGEFARPERGRQSRHKHAHWLGGSSGVGERPRADDCPRERRE